MRIVLILLTVVCVFGCSSSEHREITFAPKHISSSINGIEYISGNWQHPNYTDPFTSLGNHRFVVQVQDYAPVVRAHIPWRRRDLNPAEKDVVIVNADNGAIIKNKWMAEITQMNGDLVFAPDTGFSTYYIYYLPHESTGGYYPKVNYIQPKVTADDAWLKEVAGLQADIEAVPKVTVLRAESIDDFHSFFPMEIAASQEEVQAFVAQHDQQYYAFPEYRSYPIRMQDFLPHHWATSPLANGLRDTADSGEFYTFQIGLFAPGRSLSDIKIDPTDLILSRNISIEANAIHCFNIGGTDLSGNQFKIPLAVDQGEVQALWFGIDIPQDAIPGQYHGTVMITPEGLNQDTIHLTLTVLPESANNHGDDSPENMTRLRWLNSTIGTDPEFIVSPFDPVTYSDKNISITGRDVQLNDQGFPEAIQSYFAQEMTFLKQQAEPVIARPITFEVSSNGTLLHWSTTAFSIDQTAPGQVTWQTSNTHDKLRMVVQGKLEYDGMLDYKLTLIAKETFEVDDIVLSVPMHPQAAEYLLGLGHLGGKRPQDLSWQWDTTYHQEGVWLGNVNKGLQYVLRDDKYERPLNTNFYHNKPLRLPASWGNEGKGGIRIQAGDGAILAENYSGPRSINKGDTLHFNVRFLITPFKLIELKKHFQTRFVHKYVPVDSVEKWGGTVINVHHANEINPYINYPFFALDAQKAYIDDAHSKGIKVKLYNTIRELTYRSHELFALKSLGDEILNDGQGGGHTWLQEHMKSNYHSAWHATRVNDAAILNKGTSRWTNYYIEGLNWLAKKQEIDGLYLDDIAFSRETVKRIASVLYTHRDDVIIDLHSANQYNPRDGFINSAFLYMEHFPYISRLWFGEYFDYNADPDYWFTEVSGLPFGLTGEMLEKGGHPFRGMVYGMTTRIYGKYDPSAIWKLFDDFDIANSEMLGYWMDHTPVKIQNEKFRCTIYRHPEKVLIAIGSWSPIDEQVILDIDWSEIGIEKNSARLMSPEIEGLQKAREFDLSSPIPVKANQGLLLILEIK